MSAQTKLALEDALQAHIKDEHNQDSIITEWIIVSAGIEPGLEPGDRAIWYEDNDLPSHHATGLLTRTINNIEHGTDDD